MNPLQWMLYPLLAVGLISALFNVMWFAVVTLVLFAVLLALFIGAYIYALGKNPDLLRSEKFLATKLAIEHGFGDSLHGQSTSLEDLSPAAVESSELLTHNAEGGKNE